MTNNFIEKLTLLNNYGMPRGQEISKEEYFEKMKIFYSEVSIEKYLMFFRELDNYFVNEEIPYEEKELVFELLIEFINAYYSLKDNIDKMPNNIKMIYDSYEEERRLSISFDDKYLNDFNYENLILNVEQFLNDPKNLLYKQIANNRIQKLIKKITERNL